jgi:putative ABC transport system permease protein
LHFRLAIRALRAAPIVSAVAIVSLMLGIGANSAVFSIVNAVLLRPLPYPDSDRLVLLGYTFSGASVPLVSETKLNVWKEQTAAWENVAALRSRRVTMGEGAQLEQVLAIQTNIDYFTMFDAQVALGRAFAPAEDRPGGDRVVLLSDGFWSGVSVQILRSLAGRCVSMERRTLSLGSLALMLTLPSSTWRRTSGFR